MGQRNADSYKDHDANRLLASVTAASSAMEIRLLMAEAGWQSKDNLTDIGWGDGKYGFSIWFERWDWHGKNISKACFHRHTGDLSKIDEKVKNAALLSIQGWIAYQDSVPEQIADGSLRENMIATTYFKGEQDALLSHGG